MTVPTFPGGTAVSDLEVYASVAPDGLAGGTPHLHTVATEAYLVVAGRGELHTVDSGGTTVTPLAPGDTVWFSPGVVHRAVNRGGLRVRVLMSHAGLPEAGDAVMTFPDAILADPDAYATAATLPGPHASDADRRAAANLRRDLAVEGYLALAPDGTLAPDALALLYRRAATLVRPRIGRWQELARRTADADLTEARLAALAAGQDDDLADGRVAVGATAPAYGMCGMLTTITGGQP